MKQEAAQALLRALCSERCGQAYLVAGPADAPLQETIEKGAAALLCEAKPEERPCGVCRSCRMLANGSHPDLLRLEPEAGKKQIGVEPVRLLEGALAETSARRGKKVVLAADAHRMTPAAQNALLKTLEEPPSGVTFLLSGTESGLLPTIRSRCMIVRLAGEPPEETEEERAIRREAERAMAALCAGKPADRAAFGDNRGQLDRVLEIQTEFCRDALALSMGGRPLKDREGAAEAAKAGEKKLLGAIGILVAARKRLLQNAGIAVTIDWLLVELSRTMRS